MKWNPQPKDPCARPDCEKDARQWGFCVNHSHLFRRNGVPYRQDEINEMKSSSKSATAMDVALEENPPLIVWRLDPVRRVQVAVHVDDPHADHPNEGPLTGEQRRKRRAELERQRRQRLKEASPAIPGACERGHEFDSWNTIVKPDGSYECRICTAHLDNGPLVEAARKAI